MSTASVPPPAKARRVQRSAHMPLPATHAPSGFRVGDGSPVFEPSSVQHTGSGRYFAWSITKLSSAEARRIQPLTDASETLLWLYSWRVPALGAHFHQPQQLTDATGANRHQRTLLRVPSDAFTVVAAVEVSDRRCLLLAASNGTVAKALVPWALDGLTVSERTELLEMPLVVYPVPGLAAPVIGAGSEAVLYLSTFKSDTVVSVTLDEADGFIESVCPLTDFSPSRAARQSKGWTARLFGFLGGGGTQPTAPAADAGTLLAASNDAIHRIFSVGGHCFAVSPAGVTFVRGDEASGPAPWQLSLQGIVEVMDVAVTPSTVWLLVSTAQSTSLSLVCANSRDSSASSVVVAEIELPSQVVVAGSKRQGSTVTGRNGPRLHVTEDGELQCTIIGKSFTYRYDAGGNIRTNGPGGAVTELYPTGVLALSSQTNVDSGTIVVVSNHGPYAIPRTQMLGADHDMSNIDVSLGNRLHPAAGGDTSGNARSALNDTPPGSPLSQGAGAVNASRRSFGDPQPSAMLSTSSAASYANNNTTTAALPAANAARSYDFRNVEAAVAQMGLDDAWSNASDEIAHSVAVNPANWAKGDLAREDRDGATFTTRRLHERFDHHRALLQHVSTVSVPTAGRARPHNHQGNQSVASVEDVPTRGTSWAALSPATQAALLSRTEALAVMCGLRDLHNASSTRTDEARITMFCDAITAVGRHIKSESPQPEHATLAEIAFSNHSNASLLLFALNEELDRVLNDVTGSAPLERKLSAAVGAAELWQAGLDALQSVTTAFAALDSSANRAGRWTMETDHATSFTPSVARFAELGALALSLGLDAPSVDPTSQHALRQILNAVERALDVVFTLAMVDNAQRQSLLERTLLRAPFADSPDVGYPAGRPRPNPRNPHANHALEAVERLGVAHGIHSVLWIYAGSTPFDLSLPNDSSSAAIPPQWAELRSLCTSVHGFFEYVMYRLVKEHRLAELEALPDIVPQTIRGSSTEEWQHFVAHKAPHVAWLVQPTTSNAISLSRHRPGPASALGSTAASHRTAVLALGELAWIAEGKPTVAGSRLTLEAAVAAAQAEHLPEHADRALDAEEVVRTLLDDPRGVNVAEGNTQWVTAARLASLFPTTASRERMCTALLSRCFLAEKTVFLGVARNDTLGDVARNEQLAQTATGRVAHACAPLQKLVMQEVPTITDATSAEYATELRRWLSSSTLAVQSIE